MRPVLRAYLLTMTAPAAGAAWLLAAGHPGQAGDPALALILVLLAVAATNYQVIVTPRYTADAAPAIHFAIILLFPAAPAVALIGLGALAGEGLLTLRRRHAPVDIVFNASQLMIAAAVSATLFHWVWASHMDDLSMALGGLAAAISMYVVSTALVVVAAGLHTRRSPLDIWAEAARADLRQTVALYVAGFLLAVIASKSPWLAVVMMVPIAGVQLSLKRSMELREQTVAAVQSMADLVDRRDPYTARHSRSVADHAVAAARRLRLRDREVELIALAARVHDLGKIAVPDSVLHKPGRLTEEEFALMKKHPADGAEILSRFPDYRRGRELVLAHHERLDGRGYPRGLSGEAIPLGARIIAVADAWDAMTSDRPYREAMSREVALAELVRGRGTQWDAAVVDAFASTLPGAQPAAARHEGIAAPVMRSLGAVAGLLSS